MPNSVMSRYYERAPAERAANYNTKKDFWNRWWNRKIETVDGKDGWDAQDGNKNKNRSLLLNF